MVQVEVPTWIQCLVFFHQTTPVQRLNPLFMPHKRYTLCQHCPCGSRYFLQRAREKTLTTMERGGKKVVDVCCVQLRKVGRKEGRKDWECPSLWNVRWTKQFPGSLNPTRCSSIGAPVFLAACRIPVAPDAMAMFCSMFVRERNQDDQDC